VLPRDAHINSLWDLEVNLIGKSGFWMQTIQLIQHKAAPLILTFWHRSFTFKF